MHHECIFCNHELVSCFFFLKGDYFYEKMHEKILMANIATAIICSAEG